jgi:flagellin
MRINNNVAALNAYRNQGATNVSLGKSLEKLSSGLRINRAADDAAGLVISQKLRAQLGGIRTAVRNVQDGISVVQTAEGAFNEVHSMLTRMRELSVQAANEGSNDAEAIAAAQAEYVALSTEIDHISDETTFGSTNLLDGTYTAKEFQVSQTAGDTVAVTIANADSAALAVAGLTVGASATTTALDAAINTVSEWRGDLGALQNRFESMVNNLNVSMENLTASESRIRDADMALEMVSFTKSQILVQAGTAMIAQANSVPQSVLRLLQ